MARSITSRRSCARCSRVIARCHPSPRCKACDDEIAAQRAVDLKSDPSTIKAGPRTWVRLAPIPAGPEQDEQLERQQSLRLEIESSIERPSKARNTKPGTLLGKPLKAGASALDSDDLDALKRPVYKAIRYVTEGGELVAAIFGGMSPNAEGTTMAADDAERAIEAGSLPGGTRVVLWPSEMQRRGAAPAMTVDLDLDTADSSAICHEFPIIAARPAPVQAAIEAARERKIRRAPRFAPDRTVIARPEHFAAA